MSVPVTGRSLTRVELAKEVQELHRRYWDDQMEAARGKAVVLVEGDDDADVVGATSKQTSLGSTSPRDGASKTPS